MLSLIGWLAIGLVAGLLARLLVAGPHPAGWVMTTAVSLIGSLLGGLIFSLILGIDLKEPGFHAGGLIGSTLGAALVLGAYVAYVWHSPPA
jgi:uncharacterized membrane protein YeaQ/YmgE (transglycosylase-associated protein family)